MLTDMTSPALEKKGFELGFAGLEGKVSRIYFFIYFNFPMRFSPRFNGVSIF